MILWLFIFAPLPSLCASAYPGACQQVKRRKDAGENRIRPGGKRVRIRHPKLKDGGGKGQSLLTQVLDKGRFVRLDQSTSLTPGRNIELRCKGNSIGWSYPTNLDTFNDSRLRCLKQTSAVGTLWVDVNAKVLYVCFPPAASNRVTSTVSWSWLRPLLLTQVPTAAGCYCVTAQSVRRTTNAPMSHTSISQVIK